MTTNQAPSTFRDVVPVEARNEEIGSLLGLLRAGTRSLRRELGDVDEETAVWQPYPNGQSIGAILIHVAACEAWWLHMVAGGQETSMDLEAEMMGGPRIDQYDGVWPAPPHKPIGWYYTQHDEIRVRSIALISQLPDPDEVRAITWRPDQQCTVRWILHHIIEHEAYHLGQAVMLSLMRGRM